MLYDFLVVRQITPELVPKAEVSIVTLASKAWIPELIDDP
jgi:hypothetical protein